MLPDKVGQQSGELVLVNLAEDDFSAESTRPLPGKVVHPRAEHLAGERGSIASFEFLKAFGRPCRQTGSSIVIGRQFGVEMIAQSLAFSQPQLQDCAEFQEETGWQPRGPVWK